MLKIQIPPDLQTQDEGEVGNQNENGQVNGLLKAAQFVFEVHKVLNDVGRLDKRQADEHQIQ